MTLQIIMFLVSYTLLILICRLIINRFEYMAELGNKARRNRESMPGEEIPEVTGKKSVEQGNLTQKAA